MSEQRKADTEQETSESENATLEDDASNSKVDAVVVKPLSNINTPDNADDIVDDTENKIEKADNVDTIDSTVDNSDNTAVETADNVSDITDMTDNTAVETADNVSDIADMIDNTAENADEDRYVEPGELAISYNGELNEDIGHNSANATDAANATDSVDAVKSSGAEKDKANIKKKDDEIPSLSDSVNPDLPEAKPMTLMQHLGELRSRLVRSAIIIGLAFIVCYSFAEPIFNELMRPLINALPPGSKLIFTSLPEAFFVYLQVGFVTSIFASSPFLFYQIWSFIAPGLYDEEKKYAIPIAIVSAFFFICGAAFCYLVVFPFSFEYFMSFATDDIIPMPSISQYFSFALKILIAFGLIFEMPLFTFFLSRMGIVTANSMRKVRKYAILVIFIVAAILTPPDVISQLLMAIPMIFLYEVSIYIAVVFGRKSKKEKEAEAEENRAKENEAQKNKAQEENEVKENEAKDDDKGSAKVK